MRIIIITTLFLSSLGYGTVNGKPSVEIKNGVWKLPFMYWMSLSPALEGTGGITFLCEVTQLGEKDPNPRQFQSGTLRVIEYLSEKAKEFSPLNEISIKSCDNLEVGDQLILIVGIERLSDGSDVYCVIRHRGTNCLLGHRLTKKTNENYNEQDTLSLLNLARKGFPQISKLTPDEMRTFALMDPDGVREALIRGLEIKAVLDEQKNQSSTSDQLTPHKEVTPQN